MYVWSVSCLKENLIRSVLYSLINQDMFMAEMKKKTIRTKNSSRFEWVTYIVCVYTKARRFKDIKSIDWSSISDICSLWKPIYFDVINPHLSRCNHSLFMWEIHGLERCEHEMKGCDSPKGLWLCRTLVI